MAEALTPCVLFEGLGVVHADPCTCSPGVDPDDMRLTDEVAVGSAAWRAEHCRRGDYLLGTVENEPAAGISPERVAVVAALAQAHYAAANVRYRP